MTVHLDKMMKRQDHIFRYPLSFELESGKSLSGFQLQYTTLGNLHADKSNVVWVCHALSGSSNFSDWWNELFREGAFFDPNEYFIIAANTLGGCYGSTGPLSLNPQLQKSYYHDFPQVTNHDIARAFDLLREELGFTTIHTLIGGSLGGQQVLEWAIQKPAVFQHLIPIACNAFHSPWGIAFNESQRMAIETDSTWSDQDHQAGINGLKTARAIGMISYRHYHTYNDTQCEKTSNKTDDFFAASYQRYQGQKLASRFNAFTYWFLSKAMDSHNVGRNRNSAEDALQKIKARTLVVGIDSDILFPIEEQKYLADHIPNASLQIITSRYGHDGFLVEFNQLNEILTTFYKNILKEIVQ